MTTSKIKTIHKVTKYEKNNNVTFYYDIEFENGDRGSKGKATENALKV